MAARGIDLPNLELVVHADLPTNPDTLLHRSGRTGRAGQSGQAISFVTADAEAHFQLIEKRQNLSLPREQIAGFEPTEVAVAAVAPPAAPGNGGIKGKRPSKKDKLRAAGKLPALGSQDQG